MLFNSQVVEFGNFHHITLFGTPINNFSATFQSTLCEPGHGAMDFFSIRTIKEFGKNACRPAFGVLSLCRFFIGYWILKTG
jgi:hypothetical protein